MIRVLFTLFIIFCISYGFLFLHHLVLARYKFKFDESALLMFFGLPGSGKSTVCAEIVRQLTSAWKDFKNRISIFCNFPVRGANRLDRSMIGSVDFCGENDRALLLLDEASTVYFKRNAMQKGKDGKLQFSDAENQFHSMHRHYHTMEVCFAQSWDGVDIRLRELSTGLFYVEKSRIRGFIKIRKIGKIFTINEDHFTKS